MALSTLCCAHDDVEAGPKAGAEIHTQMPEGSNAMFMHALHPQNAANHIF